MRARYHVTSSKRASPPSQKIGWVRNVLFPIGWFRLRSELYPPNWTKTKLTTRRWTKPAGLIESCTQGVGAPTQTPLGLRPKPRWDTALNLAGAPIQTPFRRGGSGGPTPLPPLATPLTNIVLRSSFLFQMISGILAARRRM